MAEMKSDVIVAEKKGRWWSTKKKVVGALPQVKPIQSAKQEPCEAINEILSTPDVPPQKPQRAQTTESTPNEKQMNVKEYLLYRLQEIAEILNEYIVIQEDEEAKKQQIAALEEQLKKLKA